MLFRVFNRAPAKAQEPKHRGNDRACRASGPGRLSGFVRTALRRRRQRCLAAGLFVLGFGCAAGPSFDCSRAASAVERLVCSTPDLGALDQELADLFATQLQLENASPRLREAQRAWMRSRNHCQDVECLRQSYARRVLDLACMDGPLLAAAIGAATCAKARLRVLDRQLDAQDSAGPAGLARWRAVRTRNCLERGEKAGGAPGWQATTVLQCEVEATQSRLAGLRPPRSR